LAWAVWVLSGLWVLMMAWVFVALARGMFPGPA
jgi:amino acid transporter